MYIDLSPLESYGKSAVRCKTEEHARMFVKAMWEQYPSKMDGVWRRDGQTNWDLYEDEPDGVCYLHRIAADRGSIRYCQSSSYQRAVDRSYKIIEFEDLICSSIDLGEIHPSANIFDLFGT